MARSHEPWNVPEPLPRQGSVELDVDGRALTLTTLVGRSTSSPREKSGWSSIVPPFASQRTPASSSTTQ